MVKKNIKYLHYICTWAFVLLAAAFSACNRIEDDLVSLDEVKLTATLSPVLSTVYTKGEGEIKSTYNMPLSIGMAKVIGNGGDFRLAENNALPATMSAPSQTNLGLRDIEFTQFQGFPDASTPVNYIGWYPYDGGTFSNPISGNTTVSFTVPVDASTDILYSDVASGTRLRGFNTMTFRHALAKYSIKVYAMEDENEPGSVTEEWGKITSVSLAAMPSTCKLILPASSADLPEIEFGSETMTLIRTDFTLNQIPVGLSNVAVLTTFLAPPPGDNELSIELTTEKGGTKSQRLSIATDFESGKNYQIYLRFTTHGTINADIKVEDWVESETPIDVPGNVGLYYNLSESQSANSYMVSSAYGYCFDVTVRGNGYTGIAGIPGAQEDLYMLETPVTAEIIWTDLVSASTPELEDDPENLDKYFILSPNVIEGKVFFTIPHNDNDDRHLPREGNVVIGVKNADGDLIWTWHIWLTDRPHEQGYKNGFAVQDRDLGATAYKPTGDVGNIAGLYYQWGRPTPLPLDKDVYKPEYNPESGAWIQNTLVDFQTVNVNTSKSHSIIQRVESPTYYYDGPISANADALTKSLWGWRSESDEYAKTIYDPCPPGYRVPSIKLWRDLYIHNASTVNDDSAVEFHINVNELVVYYPMTGYYSSRSNFHNDPKGAYMWAATFDIEDNAPYGLDFIKGNSGLQVMETVTEPSNNAMPVRCVSRMSKAHVTDLSDYQTANSYIVSDKGYYKFKATVRGNGIGQLVSPGSTSTIVLTEQLQTVDIKNQLVKVEPLWWKPAEGTDITAPAFTLLNDGTPDADGYVTFELLTFNEGNLVLAGYDAKGDIIWSWHLWFTDQPQMMRSNAYVVMDRNLGATYAPAYDSVNPEVPEDDDLTETYGLYYQWGRKDPFLPKGSTIYEYDANSKIYNSISAESAFDTNADQGYRTVANSVLNPMTFHLASNPNNGVFVPEIIWANSYVYVSTYNNYAENQCFSNMVHPENRASLWGYSAMKGEYGVTSSKTMYDPCPPGYAVAYYLVWTNTERNDSYNLYYSNLDGNLNLHGLTPVGKGLYLNHGLTDKTYQYYIYSDIIDRFDNTWFPFSGYINGSNYELNERGDMGVFHTSTPAGNGSRNLVYNSYVSGQGINGSSLGMPSTFAYPVRCQKE